MFKEASTSSWKENENGVEHASPYIVRAMKNCKTLELLITLASSIQVLIKEHSNHTLDF